MLLLILLLMCSGIGTAESGAAGESVERRELPAEGQRLLRELALFLVPRRFEAEEGWGEKTRIQSGLSIDASHGKLRTNRRWKDVNHGTWLRAEGELVDPDELFRISASQVVIPEAGRQQFDILASARIQATGRQQQWTGGVMLWSVTADALADVSLRLSVDVTTEIVSTPAGAALKISPEVRSANARLDRFRLQRISHAKGTSVRGTGELMEALLTSLIRRENRDLAARMNRSLLRHSERLVVPLNPSFWFLPATVPLPESEPVLKDEQYGSESSVR